MLKDIPFLKMHGTGNDFVIIDARRERIILTEQQIKILAHRKIGIGCDQLIVLMPGNIEVMCDVVMHIFNADASPAGMCANALRCVSYLLTQETKRDTHWIYCGNRRIATKTEGMGAHVHIGIPSFDVMDIPVAPFVDPRHFNLLGAEVPEGTCLSVGNPHLVLFYPDISSVNLSQLAQKVKATNAFPQGVNINIAQILGPERIKLRTYERGVGETLSCGSGACATLVVAAEKGLTSMRASIEQAGGNVTVTWNPDRTISIHGPVIVSFSGSFTHHTAE